MLDKVATVLGPVRIMRWLRQLLLALLMLLAPASPAQTSIGATSASLPLRPLDSGLTVTDIRWGWDGVSIAPERHTPVRIRLDSGVRAISGVVSLEYQQDASQSARVSAQFATTPGRGADVELVVCVAQRIDAMTLTLDDGEETRRVRITQLPSPSELPLPEMRAVPLRVVCVGKSSARYLQEGLENVQQRRAWDASTRSPYEERRRLYAAAQVVTVAPGDLPSAWMAYESVDVVVVHEDDVLAMAPNARDALHTWVHSGGHLLLRTSAAGNGWRRAVPEFVFAGLAGDAIHVDEQRDFALSDRQRYLLDAGDQLTSPPTAGKASEAIVEVIRARPVVLMPTALARGWRVDLLDDAPDAGRQATQAWLATGPAGFGTVTLLTIEPDELSQVLRNAATGAAWRRVLSTVLSGRLLQMPNSAGWGYSAQPGSGASVHERHAVRALMDLITRARPVSGWFFIIAVVSAALVVLLVGPVGRELLKLRGWLRRGWAVSLGLIALASVISLLAPLLVRSGQSSIGRVRVSDIWCDAGGQPLFEASTTLLTAFAGRPETLAPAQADPTAWSAPEEGAEGAWWRGVSSLSSQSSQSRIGSSITIAQTQPAPGVVRSGVLLPVRMGQWTYRAFLEQRPTTTQNLSAMRVQVSELSSAGVTLRLRGIPSNRIVRSAWVFAGEGKSFSLGAHNSAGALMEPDPPAQSAIDMTLTMRNLPPSLGGWILTGADVDNIEWDVRPLVPQQDQHTLSWFSAWLAGALRRTDVLTREDVQLGHAFVIIAIDSGSAVGSGSHDLREFEVVRFVLPLTPDQQRSLQSDAAKEPT